MFGLDSLPSLAPQAGHLGPVLSAVGGLEERRVLHSGVHVIGIRERWLQVPYALEFPRMRRAVVPLMRTGNAVIDELVSHRLPRLAAVARALYQLPKPAGALGRIQPIRIGRRPFQVIDLPASEVRAVDLPLLTLAI